MVRASVHDFRRALRYIFLIMPPKTSFTYDRAWLVRSGLKDLRQITGS